VYVRIALVERVRETHLCLWWEEEGSGSEAWEATGKTPLSTVRGRRCLAAEDRSEKLGMTGVECSLGMRCCCACGDLV
jgi:hypothetical protein